MNLICICNHENNRHKNTGNNDTVEGILSGWGEGACELCDCHFFECSGINCNCKDKK